MEGAKPKTPTKQTPTKKVTNIRIPDSRKIKTCILCTKEVINKNNRYRLFENVLKKNAVCVRVENALEVTVESLMYGEIICNKCDSLATAISTSQKQCEQLTVKIQEKKKQLWNMYDAALKKLSSKYAVTTSKRLTYASSPEKSAKRQLTVCNKENITFRQPNFGKTKGVEERPSKVWVCKSIILYLTQVF